MRVTTKNVESIENRFTIIRTLVGVGIALVIALALIAAVSERPLEALMGFLTGPLTSISRLGNVVEKAIPLLFTGTAVCIVFACGQISLCIEGIFTSPVLLAQQLQRKPALRRDCIRCCASWPQARWEH